MKRFLLISILCVVGAFGLSCHSLKEQKINLMFVGDIMLSGNVPEHIQDKRGGDFTFAFEKTANILKNADIVFANLETPISGKGARLDKHPELDNEPYFNAPPEALEGLKFSGIDVVSLANNHILDYGIDALLDTIKYLNNIKIKYVGLVTDDGMHQIPQVMVVEGIKLGFLAYADPGSKYCYPEIFRSFPVRPAEAGAHIITEDIHRLKKKVDIVIVSLHWGTGYTARQNERQEQLGKFIIDQGATIVVGHHPHYLQPIAHYKDGVILYSLGNFVFDLYLNEKTRISEIVKIEITGNKINALGVLPVKINEFWQPVPQGESFKSLPF